MSDRVYTPKQDSIIKRMWKAGDSTSRIAAVLDAGITKNGVISRARRIGCKPRPSPIRNAKPGEKKHRNPLTPAQRERKRELDRARLRRDGSAPRPADWGAKVRAERERREAAPPPPPAPVAGSMSFTQAALEGRCTWPYGDLLRGGCVCGGDLAKGSRSWCASHVATAVHRKGERADEQPKEAGDGAVA